ncbi:MAG: acetate kinase [Clostridia bacterium]|nr:acetate kinase [Clostridia bacterium]
MNVLVVNAGSSSLKYQLFDTSKNEVLAKGICERIGIDGKIEHKINGQKYTEETAIPNHTVATQLVVKYLTDEKMGCVKSMDEIEAVGHRIVHGGEYFSESMLLTDETLEKLELCRDLAPLHTGAHIMGIQGCLEAMPGKPQVLVFDTAFHQTMSQQAYMYGLPYEMYEKYHIRRYGAHGTSHRYVAAEAAKLLDKPVEETKIVTCHIGNGSSISAVKGGKCIDTSMGFTPLAGVLMGTRCGDIDPAIVTYIMKNEGYTPDEMSDFMNKKCGFLGLSGISSDSRDIEAAILKGDKRAEIAATTLAYQIKKYIGSYAAAMDGLDAVIFTAGMGENNPELRERACANLENFGIKIDVEVNAKAHHQSDVVLLSTPDSKVKVYLIPTNEELVIASDTEAIVKAL